MLVNDVSLRGLIPGELAKGFGFFQGKPSTAFSPVAVTPDELGEAWDGGKVNLPLMVDLNGKPFGRADAGVDMTFDFPALIAHAAKTRRLGGRHHRRLRHGVQQARRRPRQADRRRRRRLFLHRRVEDHRDDQNGGPKTPFLRFGDTVRIEMRDAYGHSIFGAIEQAVESYARDA